MCYPTGVNRAGWMGWIAFAGAVLVCGAGYVHSHAAAAESHCGAGFTRAGARCCVGATIADCSVPSRDCPKPLIAATSSCDAPLVRVEIPATRLFVGASDWEAEGRVAARVIETAPFLLDAFEVTEGHFARGSAELADSARAASGMTRSEAAAYCRSVGGRLPKEDEWIVAAAGSTGRRYPWGETGAVCRRGAWGLLHGPCGSGASGPDTVGAHPDGNTPSGLYDMAGNVAEWVDTEGGLDVARGGSWASSLATELRTWSRKELSSGSRSAEVGVRCAYDLQ